MKAELPCELCKRVALIGGKYCRVHEIALNEVQKGFEKWDKAFVSMSWERYLESISKLREAGDASRQIAKHLLKHSK